MANKQKTCCFTGHRTIAAREAETLVRCLHETILELMGEGYTHFLSGGAIGFDLVAASLVVTLKQQGHPLSLELVLPCGNHDERWGQKEKWLLGSLRYRADKVTVLQTAYTDGCMRRNRLMVDRSSVCIAYLRRDASGTGQTVRYAVKKGLRVLHL